MITRTQLSPEHVNAPTVEELEMAGAEAAEPPAARTLERVRERIYARDWARLGLAHAPFRLAHANAVYTLCRR